MDNVFMLDLHIRYETTAHLWLVLEYCVGGDLMTLLKQVAICTMYLIAINYMLIL